MQFRMKNLDKLSLSEMEQLLSGSRKITFQIEDTEEKYKLIAAVLKTPRYAKLDKQNKGIVRRFLQAVTTTSRAQLTRLIARWMENRQILRRPAVRPEFTVRYTPEDIALLAATDAAHEDLSGPALCHILRREFEVFGNQQYQRLAGISVSHLYNLRSSPAYPSQQGPHRRAPQIRSQGQAGISPSRHCASGPQGRRRGDLLYQLRRYGHTVAEHRMCSHDQRTAHDASAGTILHQYPFRILGFHSDNGSEFLNTA